MIFKPIIPLYIMLILTLLMFIVVLINKKNTIVRIVIILCLFIVSQRPIIRNVQDEVYNNLDILFVIDTTVSMNAIDMDGDTRLNAVKRNCQKIIDEFYGAHFGIITFDNYSMIKIPFVDDREIVLDTLSNLDVVDANYAIGTSIDLPYKDMSLLLNENTNRKKVVFFISDGELTIDIDMKNLDKYQDLKNLIYNGAVLGYGSKDGSKIKIFNSIDKSKIVDNNDFLIDKTSDNLELAISKLDEQKLLYLKDKLSLDYYHMNDFDTLNRKIKEIKKGIEESQSDEEKRIQDKELYYYFSFIMLILLLYDLFYFKRGEQ